jgi:hypothetical protein
VICGSQGPEGPTYKKDERIGLAGCKARLSKRNHHRKVRSPLGVSGRFSGLDNFLLHLVFFPTAGILSGEKVGMVAEIARVA